MSIVRLIGSYLFGGAEITAETKVAAPSVIRMSFDDASWHERLRDVTISKATMNKLVLDYLIIEGHKDAAARFKNETGMDTEVDFETIADRMAVRAAVEAGDIRGAIELVNQLSSDVLLSDASLRFRLNQQQMIELVRLGNIEEARPRPFCTLPHWTQPVEATAARMSRVRWIMSLTGP